jgi:hypothetical protein
MGLPYLGVQLSTHDIVGSPAGYFDQNQLVNFAPQGGSSTIYNNIWYNNDLNNTLFPGSTLSGFLVHVTDVAAPTTVSWFAFGYDNGFHGSYTGGGNFYTNTNPGFEGVAAVPLPAAAVLFGSGLVGIVGWLQKQKARAGLSNRSSVIRL